MVISWPKQNPPMIRPRIRAPGWVLLALALLVPPTVACAFGDELNGGCGSHGTEDVVTGDLVGTWSGTNAGTVVLAADGTFTAEDLRQKDAHPDRLSGRGTWSLTRTSSSATKRPANVSDVLLAFVQPDGTKTEWNRIDVDHNVRPVSRLEYLYGDAEDCDLRVLNKR
jgi:hypothetical protein